MVLSNRDRERLRDKRWRIEHLYKIVNKEGQIVTFKMNRIQEILFEDYQAQRELVLTRKSQYGIREEILKARQEGVTTFHCIYYLDEVIWNRGRTAAIIAHQKDALEKIFKKVKFAWESMPDVFRPKASTENVRELTFSDIQSSIYIALKVRSGTVHHLHISEKAHMDNPVELKTGSYQAVPMSGDLTTETTGNGLNFFYHDWQQNKRSPIWKNKFFSWTDHPDYQSDMKVDPVYIFGAGVTDEYEEYLKDCTQKQKNWWYLKLQEMQVSKKNSSVTPFEYMKQEYPLTEEDAFIRSGKGIFGDVVSKPGICEPIDVDWEKFPDIPELYREFVTVYEYPVPGDAYCTGADVAEGYGDGDYSAFYIINSRTRKIALEWHGKIAQDLFGLHIMAWGYAYNYSFTGVEVNKHFSTVAAIKDEYSDLYQRERRDKVTDEITQELGWLTTSKTKNELLDEIIKNLRDGDVSEIPEGLKNELSTYIKHDSGEYGAEAGCYDDRVMAFGICLMMVRHNPWFEVKKKVGKFMGRPLEFKRGS